MSYSQLEKILMGATFDRAFRSELIDLGESARKRFAFEDPEGEVLDRLLANQGEGLKSILSVITAATEIQQSLNANGMLPHQVSKTKTEVDYSNTRPGGVIGVHAA